MDLVFVQALVDQVIEARGVAARLLDQLEQGRRDQPVAIEPDEKITRNARKPSRAITQKSSP